MKTASKKMRIILFLLKINLVTSCSAQTLQEQLVNALNASSLQNITYTENQLNRVKIVYPTNINESFNPVLLDSISNDSNIENLCSGGSYLIKYEVKALSPNFVSILKIKASNFCDFYDDIEYQTLNLFLANDNKVYSIILNNSAQLKNTINNFIFQDPGCNSPSNTLNTLLLFTDKKLKLFIVKDKVCNELIDYTMNNDLLSFNTY